MTEQDWVLLAAAGAGFCAGCLFFGLCLADMEERNRNAFLRGFSNGANPMFWINKMRGK